MSKYLPYRKWPQVDRIAWEEAFRSRDIFDEPGGGAHLACSTRRVLWYAYRRWLAFLQIEYPNALEAPSAVRVTTERIRAFVDSFGLHVRPTTVATAVEKLVYALRLIAPEDDWHWLKGIANRLKAGARSIDRFDRLVPGRQILDYGIELMEEAIILPPTSHRDGEVQYRDGLLLALLSVWPIRRRSLAALTITGHVERDGNTINLLLHSADTKSGRAESFRLPDLLVPYFERYLDDIRPRLLSHHRHDGLWASFRFRPLSEAGIYLRVSKLLARRFGKAMGVHDFRRSAATFLAIDNPDLVGIVPGVLQHASPEVGEQHYNLARGTQASRRYAAFQAEQRKRLRQPRKPGI